jgi:osmoprotectant transport system permease protein
MLDHLDELIDRLQQHIVLTAIALAGGFVISFALAVIAVRRRAAYGPIVVAADVLYVIPSLAFFAALISVTGITVVTVEIPLILYTLLIFVRNIAEGFDAVPPDVVEAADGMGYTPFARLRSVEIPLAIPLMAAGLRLASVSTIGLVTVSAVLGDRFGGLGFFILEGYHRSFPTETYFGAIPSILLAVVADVLFVRLQARLTPWSRAVASAAAAPTPVTEAEAQPV